MDVSLWIEIDDTIDAAELWKRVQSYNVNVTEVVIKTWIHGKCSKEDMSRIIAICTEFGDIKATIKANN